MDVFWFRASIGCNQAPAPVTTRLMRCFALGLVSATLLAGCSDDTGRRPPPDTAIDDRPAALTNQTHVRITFHANGVANRFTCQLDGATPSECLSPFEADVGNGDHSFEVTAALNT